MFSILMFKKIKFLFLERTRKKKKEKKINFLQFIIKYI